MPKNPRPSKRTKRSVIGRKIAARKKAEALKLVDLVNRVEEGSEEIIFNRLLAESSNDTIIQFDDSESETSSEDNESDPDFCTPLVVEKSPDPEENNAKFLSGRRIVDIGHILKQCQLIFSHSKTCTMGKYIFQREIRSGIFSTWMYHCDNCDRDFAMTSEERSSKQHINDAVAWGAMSIGIGFTQIEEFFSILDIPLMGHNKFAQHEAKVGKAWEETMVLKMKENAEAEKRIAIDKGHIMHGLPYITVIGDGGWAKRSYGHGMNSLSGVGVIIGAETNKLLYLGVKNKFCFACANPKKKKEKHECFKNYTGSSTGMEANIIVQGFKSSEDDYGLIYRNYIGDGDSSVFARIQEGCQYGRYVQKVECANHMTRALNDNLHKLAENTKYPLASRQLLSKPAPGESISRLERLVKGVRTAIKQAGGTSTSSNVVSLRGDLRNATDHIFGHHAKCGEFCKRKSSGKENNLPKLDNDFLGKIRSLLGNLENKSHSLVLDQTTNVAERYMGCVAKFTGGKRLNLSTGGSFTRRCFGAALSHSAGPSWHLSPWKKMHQKSLGAIFKQKILSREHRRVKRKLLLSAPKPSNAKRRCCRKLGGAYDHEYGPLAIQPDMEDHEFEKKRRDLMESLAGDIKDGQTKVERETVGQNSNQKWNEKRMNRLTASKFGAVVKRLPHTSCHNLVKSLLYPKQLNSDAVAFGRDSEEEVVKMYEEKTNNKVRKCGLFVDLNHPYLGASPDGLVSSEGLLEIKCLFSVHEKSLEEEISQKNKTLCLELDKGSLRLKRTHNYYHQVQGQLNICERRWCDFVVFTRKGEMFIERISRDKTFWQDKMLPKLVIFYQTCMLPEIVDSRVVRGLQARDPPHILQAQAEAKNKKKRKET